MADLADGELVELLRSRMTTCYLAGTHMRRALAALFGGAVGKDTADLAQGEERLERVESWCGPSLDRTIEKQTSKSGRSSW